MSTFDGLMVDRSNLARLSDAKTRSICSENRTGAKAGGARDVPPVDADGKPTGCARDLGQGWKVHPCDAIKPGETFVLADIEGPGCIQHMWMTPTGDYRTTILRVYYDGQSQPAVESPIGDFFASAYTSYKVFAPITSLAVCVNPGNAFNCYWPMPFRKRLRMTLENVHRKEDKTVFFQIDYALNTVPDDAAYFHAQFRRTNPLTAGDVYTILDGVRGQGHYVGTYMAWQLNNNGWWGEGEIKFYLDGDTDPALSDGKSVAARLASRRSAAPARKTTFAGRTTSKTRPRSSTRNSPAPTPACPTLCAPTASTRRTCASASIAGTSPTPCDSSAISRSRSRPSAGAATVATCRCATTSPRWPSGIRANPPRHSRPCPRSTSWKSSSGQSENPSATRSGAASGSGPSMALRAGRRGKPRRSQKRHTGFRTASQNFAAKLSAITMSPSVVGCRPSD